MNPIRKLRTESILQKAIIEIINKAFGPVASVSGVKIADNSKSAIVTLQIFDTAVEAHDIEGCIRIKIGKSISLRNTPKLSFIITKAPLDAS